MIFRVWSVLLLNGLTAVLGFLSGVQLFFWTRNQERSFLKKMELLNSIVFAVHGSFSIWFIYELNEGGGFNLKALIILAVACGTTLIYMLLILNTVNVKMKILHRNDKGFWRSFLYVAIISIVLAKVSSFVLMFYVAAINIGAPSYYKVYKGPLGQTSKFLNLSGNLAYSVLLCWTSIEYMRLFENFEKNRVALGLDKSTDSKNNVKKLLTSKRVWFIATNTFCGVSFILSILSFTVIQHSFGVALNALASVVFHAFHIWMDRSFKKVATSTRLSAKSSSKQSDGKVVQTESTKALAD